MVALCPLFTYSIFSYRANSFISKVEGGLTGGGCYSPPQHTLGVHLLKQTGVSIVEHSA